MRYVMLGREEQARDGRIGLRPCVSWRLRGRLISRSSSAVRGAEGTGRGAKTYHWIPRPGILWNGDGDPPPAGYIGATRSRERGRCDKVFSIRAAYRARRDQFTVPDLLSQHLLPEKANPSCPKGKASRSPQPPPLSDPDSQQRRPTRTNTGSRAETSRSKRP